MKLSEYMLVAESAGTQTIEPGRNEDRDIKRYLKKKQDKLDKTRRSVAPFPEDKDASHDVEAAVVEPGHWSPAPEDVKSLNKKSYKRGMKKAREGPFPPLNRSPGAVPLQDVTGQARRRRV